MAKSLSTVFKINLFTSLYTKTLMKQSFRVLIPVRQLYAQRTLGLDGYIQSRDVTRSQFQNMSDKFRSKMSEYVADTNNKNMIFTEDLKNMIHLAESSTSDVDLVINMMKKFNQQNKELRFGNFVFGPVVMRMFYFLNEHDAALKCFRSPELEGFFEQLMSYQLLLDLLYENTRYNDVIKTFEFIKDKQLQGTKYPKNIVVLTMAACYKMNTPESAKYALGLWKELNEVGHLPMRRAATFCAGLAVNQGQPEAAKEIIGSVRKQNYVTVRNINALALADIGRIEEMLIVLKSVLEIDDPNNIKHTFCQDVLDRCRTAVEKNGSVESKQEFKRIEKHLIEQGHIVPATLDSQLCTEIVSPPTSSNDRRNSQNVIPRYKYQGERRNNYRVFNQRPGLKEMN